MSAGSKPFEPVGQFGGVALVKHGGELTDQLVDMCQFLAMGKQQS
jgi:hypothetical protein